jgi:hypothetical protein
MEQARGDIDTGPARGPKLSLMFMLRSTIDGAQGHRLRRCRCTSTDPPGESSHHSATMKGGMAPPWSQTSPAEEGRANVVA